MQQQLKKMRARLLVMCNTVGEAIDLSVKALMTNDKELAWQVVNNDKNINAMEDEIDSMALNILALYQPVARDLRFVVSTLRMVIDLERIGDEASLIADRVIYSDPDQTDPLPLPEQAITLYHQARKVFADAVEAFKEEDGTVLKKLFETDHEHAESTQAEVNVMLHVLENNLSDQYPLSVALQLLLVVRSLNRIWGRSYNILEHVWFICKGESIKHRPPSADD